MLTIEPECIFREAELGRCRMCIVRLYGATGELGVGNNQSLLSPEETKQFADAFAHFAAHGTFCPEPVKPIEWTQAIPGVLWYSGEWWIWCDEDDYYYARHKYGWKQTVKCFADARAYAESQIRKGTP